MIDIQFCATVLAEKSFIAYLDPGTGSLVLQVLLAALLGCGFTIKLFWHKIITFFGFLGGKKTSSENSQVSCDSTEKPEA